MSTDNTISLYKLKNKVNKNSLEHFTYSIQQSDSFRLVNHSNPQYVDPIFSIQMLSENTKSFDDASIILISAAGATGKTSLTEKLSYDLGIPVFDLSKHEPVASNSLTGLLYNTMELSDFMDFSQKLKSGKSSMIIDALDEGYIKTTDDGFYAFLDNIIKMASDSTEVPFVLLGRTNIIEIVTLYLEEKGVKLALLQIEPFTIESAKNFIDKHVSSETRKKYVEQYNTVRDYIVNAIGGFFKNQSEINHKQYLQFIGYAPVLLAISTLLNENNNYHALLEDLKSGKKYDVKLIIDIIEKILIREKKDKIDRLLLPTLLKGRDTLFQNEALIKVYSIEEQCYRLLCKQLNENVNLDVTKDLYFDTEYNKQIGSWVDEHPFLSNGKIQNVVFESYIIAKLIENKEYKDRVYRYLRRVFRNAYMLFYIYDEIINKERIVEKDFVPFLFESLKALDKKGHYSSMELIMQNLDKTTDNLIGELNFFKADSELENYSYIVKTKKSDTITLGSDISNIFIDMPLKIELSANKIDCSSPIYIKCDTISCTASEILLNIGTQDDTIIFECQNFIIGCSEKGTLPSLTNKGKVTKEQFQLICRNQLSYPFIRYKSETSYVDVSEDIMNKYQKMRRVLLMFRSHSKGDLARYKEKIDNRIGNSKIGKMVLDSLLNKGILYPKDLMYFVDTDKLASELGVKYNDIRSSIINDKIKTFLLAIQ